MIQILGDVYLDQVYKSDLELNNFIFNLEYPISSRGMPHKNKINLIQKESYIKETFGNNPIAVCLANNHIMDYGEEAFLDTLEFLEKENIKYFGAGREDNNFNNPLKINLNNKSYSLFGYCCESTSAVFGNDISFGSAKIDLNKMEKDLKDDNSEYKIVQLHWGVEDIPFPKYEDVKIAHKIIGMGADLIIGHHAHILQSIEDYKGKKIFYGLGNCIFPDINQESYYDGIKFTKYSNKKQRTQNKISLLIELDNSNNINVRQLFFNKNKLFSMSFKIPRFIPYSKESFNKKYNRYKKYDMFKKFFESPQFPTIKHIKRLLS